MKNIFKYALVFMGGVTVGVGICVVKMFSYAVNKGYLKDIIKKAVSNKLNDKFPKPSYRYFIYVENITFESRDDVEQVCNDALDILEKYGELSVAELHHISGNTDVNYINTKYGWTSLNNFEILRTRKGYELRVPKAMRFE